MATPTLASKIAAETIRVHASLASLPNASPGHGPGPFFFINVYESHRMGLGSTCSAMGPTVGGRSVHRDARPTGQFVLERHIEDQLAGMGQPGHAHAIVARLVRPGKVNGVSCTK